MRCPAPDPEFTKLHTTKCGRQDVPRQAVPVSVSVCPRRKMPDHTHTHTRHTHTPVCTLTPTHPYIFIPSHPLTCTYSHTPSPAHIRTYPHAQTLTQPHAPTHSRTHSTESPPSSLPSPASSLLHSCGSWAQLPLTSPLGSCHPQAPWLLKAPSW